MKELLNRAIMVFVFILALPVALLVGAVGAAKGLWLNLLSKTPETKTGQSIS